MKIARVCLPVLVLMFAVAAFAQDKADEKPAAAPAVPAAASAAPISAGDDDALKANMDKNATVEGTVSRANWSNSGSIFFINFDEAKTTKFTAVFFKDQKEAMEKAFDGDVVKALKGNKIQVTGKIIDYKGKPEMKLEKPEQIKVVAKAGDSTEEKKDSGEKKDESKDKEAGKDK